MAAEMKLQGLFLILGDINTARGVSARPIGFMTPFLLAPPCWHSVTASLTAQAQAPGKIFPDISLNALAG